MPRLFQSLAKVLLAGASLSMGVLVLSPSPATAETSVHKLNKRLRKVERNTGAAFRQVGQVVVDGLSCLPDISVDLSGDDGFEPSPAAPRVGKTQPHDVHQPQPAKPTSTGHPAHK
jgi:hypothetical protein